MAVTIDEVRQGVRRLELSGVPLCVHSSLRSFGFVDGGAEAIIEGLLAEGCTLLVPTFSSEAYEVPPPPGVGLARNGLDGNQPRRAMPGVQGVYTPDVNDIDSDMGAIPAAVLAMPGRVRSPHLIRSFAAIGSRARDLIPQDAPAELFGPLMRLSQMDGSILIMGVGLDKITAIHLAEQQAGRRMFQRWANGPDGRPVQVEVGGCSDGFINLDQALAAMAQKTKVGQAAWRAYPARELLATASTAIREQPSLTHCSDPHCVRCDDAAMGGPILVTGEGV